MSAKGKARACRFCRDGIEKGSASSLIRTLEQIDRAQEPGAHDAGRGYVFAAGYADVSIRQPLESLLGVHLDCMIGRLAGALTLQRSRIALGLILPHSIIWTRSPEASR